MTTLTYLCYVKTDRLLWQHWIVYYDIADLSVIYDNTKLSTMASLNCLFWLLTFLWSLINVRFTCLCFNHYRHLVEIGRVVLEKKLKMWSLQTDRRKDRWTDGRTDRRTDKHTDGQTVDGRWAIRKAFRWEKDMKILNDVATADEADVQSSGNPSAQ